MSRAPTNGFNVLHLFCGAGGGGLGFARAGFRSVGAFDVDAQAIRDHDALTGEPGTVADLATMEPHELRAACTGRPDVVFTSPPCKSFSGCLPAAKATTDRYVDLSDLALRGVWIALEAFADDPPGLFLLENVPRIQSRGRAWLDRVVGLLRAYGYAVRETKHDCGELGGLAQRRRRFLLVARHVAKVPEFLYEPPARRVRGIGEVLGSLPVPVPGSVAGGPMHSLPRLASLNWVRLALVPAGGDWRDLPPEVALAHRAGRQNGGWGVEGWAEAAHAVLGEGSARNTRASVADPQLLSEDSMMTRNDRRLARLRWLADYWRKNWHGPKRVEMAHAWGITEGGSLDAVLAAMERRGLIVREWCEARSVRVTAKGRRMLRAEALL